MRINPLWPERVVESCWQAGCNHGYARTVPNPLSSPRYSPVRSGYMNGYEFGTAKRIREQLDASATA